MVSKPEKTEEHKQEIIQLPEFQSSTPTFGMSTNPVDLNFGVMNRYTGAENLCTYDNTGSGTDATTDFIYEIPFDVKGVTGFAVYYNNIGGAGNITGISNGHSCKPFGETVATFAAGGFLGNHNGIQNKLYSGAGIIYPLPSVFVGVTGLVASAGGEVRMYPISWEDKRLTLRVLTTARWYIQTALTFL